MTEASLQTDQATYLRKQADAPTAFMRSVPSFQEDGYDFETGRTFNTRLSLEFGRWDDANDDGDADVATLHALHDSAVAAFGDLVDTLHSVAEDDDPSLNAGGRLKIAARIVEPKLNALAERASVEVDRVAGEIERELAAMDEAARTRDAADAMLHDGIRRHWLAMDAAARAAQCQFADRLDDDSLRALATGPAYLSGLTDKQQARLRTELAGRVAPERMQRVNRLRRGLALVAQATSALDAKANKFLDFTKARALIEREAARNA